MSRQTSQVFTELHALVRERQLQPRKMLADLCDGNDISVRHDLSSSIVPPIQSACKPNINRNLHQVTTRDLRDACSVQVCQSIVARVAFDAKRIVLNFGAPRIQYAFAQQTSSSPLFHFHR